MKKRFLLGAGLGVVAIFVTLLVSNLPHRDEAAAAVVASLPAAEIKAGSIAPADAARLKTRPSAPAPSAASSKAAEPGVATVPSAVLADAIALSSFFPGNEVAGLSDEQIAALEVILRAARKATYALLVSRSRTQPLPAGGLRLEIPAQPGGLGELRDYVYTNVADIVGADRMDSFRASLGPKFDAKFAYFGRYATTIDLSFDGRTDPGKLPEFVTMRSEYVKVQFLGFGEGRTVSTHVLRTPRFEEDFFALGAVPKP